MNALKKIYSVRDKLALRLHASPRAMAEFSLVAVALFLANPSLTSIYAGMILAVIGEAFRLWSAGYGYRNGQQYILGPYQFVRHPYYLGTLLVISGFNVASRSTPAFIATVLILGTIFWTRIRDDEILLAPKLGPDFAPYRRRVPALLPQLIPYKYSNVLSEAKAPGFSYSRAFFKGRRREIDAILGVSVGFLLMYLAYISPTKGLFQIGIGVGVVALLVLRALYYRGF